MKLFNILITGGAGYIGSLLTTKLLELGHKVTVLDTLYFKQKSIIHCCYNPNFTFIKGDVRDKAILAKAMKGQDFIVPLACLVGAPLCDAFPTEAKEVNLDAIKLICSLRSEDQKIIFPTTNSGYGTKSGEFYCTEETPLEPISLYGQTKVDAEKYLLSEGNVVTLRLATLFGTSYRTRIDLLVNNFVCDAVENGELTLYEKHFKRNFVHIRDVIDCFVFAIDNFSRLTGEAYNLGLDSANISKEELALKIKDQMPKLIIKECKSGKDPDKRNYIVSNKKLANKGFVASKTLEDGIRELILATNFIRESKETNI